MPAYFNKGFMRIVIHVRKGSIEGIYTDQPAEVLTFDHDVEGGPIEDAVRFKDGLAFADRDDAEVAPDSVAAEFRRSDRRIRRQERAMAKGD